MSFSAVYAYFQGQSRYIYTATIDRLQKKQHIYEMIHITSDRLTPCAYVAVTFSVKNNNSI